MPSIQRNFLPVLQCKKCGHEGNDYYVIENGKHHDAKCKKCETHIKFLSHEDKYGTKEQKNHIWDKTRGRCCFCGERLNPYLNNGFTTEHIDPQNNGGGHDIENLWPSCKHCNSQKGGKTLAQYRDAMKKETGKPTYVFYFEVIGYSSIGDILKKIF